MTSVLSAAHLDGLEPLAWPSGFAISWGLEYGFAPRCRGVGRKRAEDEVVEGPDVLGVSLPRWTPCWDRNVFASGMVENF